MTNVTQEDRDAAARIYQNFRDYDFARWITEGTNAGGDANWAIQLMARHREAAEAKERERIVAWLREKDGYGYDASLAYCIEAGEHRETNNATGE